MIRQTIYQHFGEDEKAFVDKAKDIQRQVEDYYSLQLTDFLNPRQLQVMRTVLGQSSLQTFSSGDFFKSEYARLLIAPDYYVFDSEDFEISLIEIVYHSKFNQLTHAQIMGSLINKLGIERQIFGDILVGDGRAQFFVKANMAAYFINTIKKIGRVGVTLKEVPFHEQLQLSAKAQEQDILVSSMRLDAILATSLKISRGTALKLIEAEKVKVNYATVSKPALELVLGDMLSIRGFGRLTLTRDKGFSKSGKHKLIIDRIAH